MFTVRGTKKFLDRVGRAEAEQEASTTALGDWYATAVFWRPQVALFVNETTLLPVIVPLAPAAGVVHRFSNSVAVMLQALGVDDAFIASEVAEMSEHVLAKTQSRQLLGVMNEFVHLGRIFADDGTPDPLALSLRLAEVPCGPLYSGNVSPDDELRARVAELRHG